MRLPALPGLEIALKVDNVGLQEYDDTEADAGTDTNSVGVRYVEAVSGANFAVEFRTDARFTYRYNDLEMRVYLDGVYADGLIYYAKRGTGGHLTKSLAGRTEYRNGQYFYRRFAFANLDTNDEQPKSDMKEKLANIGEVTAKLYRIRKLREIDGDYYEFKDAVGSEGVPEKALKGRAISSRATLEKAQAGAPRTTVSVEYPWGREPFATFVFKYRSHKDLQIEGIIPRSPSPVPLEDRDPDTLTNDEARELIRIQRQRLLDQTKIKKEKREREDEEDDEDGEDGEVTFTGVGRKRQRTSTDSGIEVIDLSNEDDEDED